MAKKSLFQYLVPLLSFTAAFLTVGQYLNFLSLADSNPANIQEPNLLILAMGVLLVVSGVYILNIKRKR